MKIQLIELFVLALIGTVPKFAHSAQSYPNEYDDFRVSSNQFQWPINYHSLTPGDKISENKTVEQVTNQIGKPLVPPESSDSRMPSATAPPGSRRPKQVRNRTTSPPRSVFGSSSTPSSPKIIQGSQLIQGSARGPCQWMSLSDFKNISMETGDLIIRDSEERPCYILTIRGFIKWDDDNYFPLKGFRVHPYATKIVDENGLSRHSPFNCSAAASDIIGRGPVAAATQGGRVRSFKEEVSVSVDCGHLVLSLQTLGPQLKLEALSFYQNLDTSANNLLFTKTTRDSARTAHEIRTEQMVFSTRGTKNTPLFAMHRLSRYMCSNRVVLVGNNSVQLELLRFDLQRVVEPSVREILDLVEANGTWYGVQRGIHSVVRCPNPSEVLNPLSSMVEPRYLRNDTTGKFVADKWMPSSSFTTSWRDAFHGHFCQLLSCLLIVVHFSWRHLHFVT